MTLPATRPERLQPPDVRRLEQMPSLPAWVASRIASLTVETQPDPLTGKWRETPTLHPNLILSANEREEVVRHVNDLEELCKQTPAMNPRAEAEALVAITKMMLVLPSQTQNEISAEARGEAFLTAVDDLPVWATQNAIRRWYRGDCSANEKKERYDYHWCPAPAELRSVARREWFRVASRVKDLQRVLIAEPRLEFSDEHCRVMRQRFAELFRSLKSSPVGKDGSGKGTGGTSVEGAYCGTQPRHSPA